MMEVASEQLESTARQLLEDRFPIYSPRDRVACRTTPLAFELNYLADSPDRDSKSRNQMQLFLYPAEGVVWIAHLLIDPKYRRRGMGSRLVQVAEQIAIHFESPLIRVHPMYGAQAFWQRMGYHLATGSARIQEKELSRTGSHEFLTN